MPWCPECGAEYREGFTVCKDCNVPLTDKPPTLNESQTESAQLQETLLTVVRDEMEFTRVASLLAEADIPVLKKHRGSGEYLELYMGVTPYGLEVYVPYAALSKAQALLAGDESVQEEMLAARDQGEQAAPSSEPEENSPSRLGSEEEQELARYMDAVNTHMQRRKKVIAIALLLFIGAVLLGTVVTILRELF